MEGPAVPFIHKAILTESTPRSFVIPSINRKALSRAEECVELR